MKSAQKPTRPVTGRKALNRRRLRVLGGGLPSGQTLKALARKAVPSALILLASGAVASLLIVAYLWFTSSDTFAIQTSKVVGNQRLNEAEVRELLDLPEGSNIFVTDMDELARRLESHPWIQHASVQRDLPSALQIDIEEFQTAAAVDLDGLYLVNHKGIPFKRASLELGELEGVVIITGIGRDAYLRDHETSEERILLALRAIRLYSRKPDRPRLGEVHLSDRRGLSLTTFENAIAIHLGTTKSDVLDERLATFDSAWASLDATQLESVRSLRIADRSPSDRVTIAFAGN